MKKKYVDKISSGDKRISFAIISQFLVISIQFFLILLLGVEREETIKMYSKLLVIISFMIALPTVIKRKIIFMIPLYMAVLFVYLLNMIVFPKNQNIIESLFFQIFVINLLSISYVVAVKDIKNLIDVFDWSSKIMFLFGLMSFILIMLDYAEFDVYSMAYSYNMLIPTIFSLYKFKKNENRILNLLIIIISTLAILLIGSRGALLVIIIYIVYIILKTIFSLKEKSSLKKILSILSIFIIIFMYIYLENIVVFLMKFLNSIGLYSRTLFLFTEESLHMSGREDIYPIVVEQIKEHPFLGNGLAFDRILLEGGYTHNIFLEIFLHFGFFFGLIILVLLLIGIVKNIVEDKFNDYFICVVCLGFIPLLVSLTYLEYAWFWILIAFLIRSEKKLFKKERV